MFKDMKDAVNVARSDELKELRQRADAMPKRSMMDAVKMGNEAIQQGTDMQALYTTGVQGQATIHRVADTGTLINYNPVYEFDLTVTIPGQQPYEVTHRQMVAHAVVGNFQPGVTTPVRVDPTDQTKLIFG